MSGRERHVGARGVARGKQRGKVWRCGRRGKEKKVVRGVESSGESCIEYTDLHISEFFSVSVEPKNSSSFSL